MWVSRGRPGPALLCRAGVAWTRNRSWRGRGRCRPAGRLGVVGAADRTPPARGHPRAVGGVAVRPDSTRVRALAPGRTPRGHGVCRPDSTRTCAPPGGRWRCRPAGLNQVANPAAWKLALGTRYRPVGGGPAGGRRRGRYPVPSGRTPRSLGVRQPGGTSSHTKFFASKRAKKIRSGYVKDMFLLLRIRKLLKIFVSKTADRPAGRGRAGGRGGGRHPVPSGRARLCRRSSPRPVPGTVRADSTRSRTLPPGSSPWAPGSVRLGEALPAAVVAVGTRYRPAGLHQVEGLLADGAAVGTRYRPAGLHQVGDPAARPDASGSWGPPTGLRQRAGAPGRSVALPSGRTPPGCGPCRPAARGTARADAARSWRAV